jgi:DNA polymerase phi
LYLQGCTFWTLKVLLGNEENGDDEFLEFFASSLDDYFTHKKSRLPGPFLSEVFQRHPMLARFTFGRLIARCGDGRTEFMKCEAMRLITGILKPVSSGKGKKPAPEGEEHKQLAKTFEEHIGSLGAAIMSIVQSPPQKSDFKVIALLFCSSCIDSFSVLYPQKPLYTLLDTGALFAALKAIEAPSKGKLHNLLTKLVERVTVELEKNPVSTKTVNAEDSKTTPSKKKKAKKSEPPTPSVEDKTPSKKKKATDEVAPMDVQIEETSSKKKQQQKSAKKVKVSKDSP